VRSIRLWKVIQLSRNSLSSMDYKEKDFEIFSSTSCTNIVRQMLQMMFLM